MMAPASPQFTTVQTAQLSAFPLSFLLPIYSLLEAVAFNSFDISFRTSWVAVHLVCVISKMKVEVRFIYWFCFRFPCVCPGKWQPGSCVYAGQGWKCVVSLTVEHLLQSWTFFGERVFKMVVSVAAGNFEGRKLHFALWPQGWSLPQGTLTV